MDYKAQIAKLDQEIASIAKEIIALAERELGPLTSGQRRDLLADNTELPLGEIARIVDSLQLH